MSDLPPGWQWTTVGEIAPAKYGKGLGAKQRDQTGRVPVIGSAGIAGRHTKALVEEPVIVVGRKGNAGAVWSVNEPSWPIDTTYYLRPPRGITQRFLSYQLQYLELGRLDSSTAIPSLRREDLEAARLVIAPIAEQERIVAAIEEHLSRLDAADAAVRPSRLRLDVLRSTTISGVLNRRVWPMVRWSDVGQTLSGRAFPSAAYADDGIRLLRPGNLSKSGRVSWTSKATTFLPETFATESPKYVLRGRSLLMNLTAQSLADDFLGRVCLSDDNDHFLLNQRIARLSSLSADDEYLFWVFRSASFRRFVAGLNAGSLIQHISTKQLASFVFPLPPPEDQRSLVAEIDAAVEAIARVELALDVVPSRSARLRRSILAAAFSGQLVAQDPDDEPASAVLECIRAEQAAAIPKRRQKASAS